MKADDLCTQRAEILPPVDDDQWYQRTAFGNGGSVFTSAATGGGNARIP